jgi:predicted secreted Zn-dependent protease
MARSTRKSAPAAPAAPAETRPFAVDSTAPFASLAKDVQQTIAENIAADKVAGLSGNELRAKYGERLTGPARRKVLRDFSLATAATIARSYAQYRDGQARIGSRHAREHGSQAAARIREHAAETVAGLSIPECRKVLRTAGHPVPAVRKGNETALREATIDALVIAGAQAA